MTEEEIEAAALSDPDAQPTDDEFWKDAVLVDYRKKRPVSIRLDQDIVEWFKGHGRAYQTRINSVLKSYVDTMRQREQAGKEKTRS